MKKAKFIAELESITKHKQPPTSEAKDRLHTLKKKRQEIQNEKELLKDLLQEFPDRNIFKKAENDAEKIIQFSDVLKYLCPALQSISNDALEIAKVATPTLAALTIAGKITLPLDSMLYAMIAVTISRMGVSTLCKDFKDPSKK